MTERCEDLLLGLKFEIGDFCGFKTFLMILLFFSLFFFLFFVFFLGGGGGGGGGEKILAGLFLGDLLCGKEWVLFGNFPGHWTFCRFIFSLIELLWGLTIRLSVFCCRFACSVAVITSVYESRRPTCTF